MRVLVTGATGKVGNAVARELAERGDEVVALVRDAAKARELLPPASSSPPATSPTRDSVAARRRASTASSTAWASSSSGSPTPGVFERVNAIGALNVIAAARAGRRTARRPHLHLRRLPRRDRRDRQRGRASPTTRRDTAYERSKQHAEELVLAEAEQGIEVVIVNPAGGLRPRPLAGRRARRRFRDAIRAAPAGVPPGGMTLVHVDDVAEGTWRRSSAASPGERYILADGYATMREICLVAVDEAGRGRVPPTLPVPLAGFWPRTAGGGRPADPPPAPDRRGAAHLPALAGAGRHHEGPRGARDRVHAVGGAESRRRCAGWPTRAGSSASVAHAEFVRARGRARRPAPRRPARPAPRSSREERQRHEARRGVLGNRELALATRSARGSEGIRWMHGM